MKKGKHNFLLLLFSVVFLTLFFSGCKKDNRVLGVNVQPVSDALNVTYSDSSKIFAHTVPNIAIPSFNDRYKYLGSNHDPYFGRTDVGLYTNINILNGQNNISFGPDPQLVSAEIILTVADLNFLGNSAAALHYSVFPISNQLTNTAVYYTSNDSLYNKNSVLASYTGTFSVMNEKLVLRIPVDNNYASSILRDTTLLVNDTTLQKVFKGFYITASGTNLNPVSQQGVIAKFDLDDANSGFYLYYQNGTPVSSRSNKTYTFTFSGTEASRFNTVKYHTGDLPPGTSLYQQLVKKDSTAGKQNLFLKGMGGSKLRVYIPGLKHYSDSFPVSVNRAELVFNVDPAFVSAVGQYLPPPKLSLLPISSTWQELFTQDQLNAVDLQRYDGNYDNVNNRYVFNIARHVQAILRGTQTNYGFYLVVADPSPIYTPRRDNYVERVVFAGSDNTTLKPKFNLSYVKLPYDKP